MRAPTDAVPDALLSRLSEFIAEHMGLYFPKNRWGDLQRGIRSAALEFGFEDPEVCLEWLFSAPLSRRQTEVLASHFTVRETYFLRDPRTFEVLEREILPPLITSRAGSDRCLRIWSAGCATGEEAYSIAMLLSRMLPAPAEWNITILGTDISRRSLETARAGVYGEWSFRSAPPWLKQRFFRKKQEGRWEIVDPIKRMVTFEYLNLMEDVYPTLLSNTTAMDLVLCRNVLMYFVPQQAEQVVQRFYRSLVDGGWLIVSPTETLTVRSSPFEAVAFPHLFLHRKDSRTPRTRPGPAAGIPLWAPPAVGVAAPEPAPSPRAARPVEAEGESAPPAAPQAYAEALALYEEGRYEDAAEKLIAVTREGQDDPQALVLLARIHANQGRLSEAIAWCEQAIAADKLNARHHYLLATILLEHGQVEEAATSLKRALYLDQDFVLGHFALGNLAQRQGRFEESRRHFNTTLTLLGRYRQDATFAESEGMTAGRLAEIIRTSETRD